MNNRQHISHATAATVVKPFFNYASLAFLVALVLLLISSFKFPRHYFEPVLLTVTHIMALGWGTMMIIGSVYQLIPVFAEQSLFSEKLAKISFVLTATGIPLLSYGFLKFDMGMTMQAGAVLINLGVWVFFFNILFTVKKGKFSDIHAAYIVYSIVWLLLTAGIGLLLVLNFSLNILSKDSLYFLSFHAHIGIAGWFLLLVTGVAARLVPMFMISKYRNDRILKVVLVLMNFSVICFALLFLMEMDEVFYLIPVGMIFSALVMLARYFYQCRKMRLRKKTEAPLKLSLLSLALILLPVCSLICMLIFNQSPSGQAALIQQYGFLIFFGWISLIILGMSFKTIPFIIWNEQFRHFAGAETVPQPSALYSKKLFNAMALIYMTGFVLFGLSIMGRWQPLMIFSSSLLLLSGCCYAVNIYRVQYSNMK